MYDQLKVKRIKKLEKKLSCYSMDDDKKVSMIGKLCDELKHTHKVNN